MNKLIKKILVEWSYRLDDGMIDLENYTHLSILREVLSELDLPVDFIMEFMGNLTEKRKSGEVWKTKAGWAGLKAGEDKAQYGMDSKETAQAYVKGGKKDTGPNIFDKPSETEKEKDSVEIEPKELPKKNKELDEDKVNNATDEFNEGDLSKDGVSDEDFEKNERVKPLGEQISLEEVEKMFPKPSKFPSKYIKVLHRLLNTSESGVKISDFTDAAGGGTLPSTAGELLTMALTSIDDDDVAKQITDRLLDHFNSQSKEDRKKSIINKKWIESALKCRQAIRDRYDREFGKGNWKLKNSSWDIGKEVETLGMSDYRKNKGFSTDVYFNIEVDGKTILDEVSLKQDKRANLLNGSTSRVYDILMRGNGTPEQVKRYDDLNYEKQALKESINKENRKSLSKEAIADIKQQIQSINGQLIELEDDVIPNKIPENLEIKVAQRKQDEGHRDNIRKNEKQLIDEIRNFDKMSAEEQDKLLDRVGGKDGLKQGSEDNPSISFRNKQRKQMKKILKHLDSGKSLNDLKLTKDMRKSLATVYLMTPEDSEARKSWEEIKDTSRQHSNDVAEFLFSSKEAKEGLIKSIREDFPLQALMSGEESMALGDLSADKETLKAIFGTDDFDEIQQNLTVVGDALVYKVKGTGKEIPISTIVSRPDGIGYGSSWKLEMKLHGDFAKELEKQRDKNK